MIATRLLAVCLMLLPLERGWAAVAQGTAPQDAVQDGQNGQDGQAAYRAGRFEKARSLWQAQAEAGDGDAAFGLGLLYDLGQGVHQDGAAAYGWYLRAASAGNAQAEFNVAVMNDSGRGTRRDEAAAALWYGRAASHGLGRAEYDLAQLYEAGEGVPRNPQAALAWYEAASSTLPAAASRAMLLRAQSKTRPEATDAGGRALAVPAPLGAPREQAAGRAAELVWSAPAQSLPVRYYVVVMSLDTVPPAPVFSGFTDRTAMLVEAAAGLRAYAWRVCAVSLETPHYAAGDWTVAGR